MGGICQFLQMIVNLFRENLDESVSVSAVKVTDV